MQLQRNINIALITFLTVAAIPFPPKFLALFSTPPALAQTTDVRKAEADRLLQQGIQQYQTSQYEAALDSWHQALILFQKLENRLKEGESLGNLGSAYRVLSYYGKAIEYHQQSLAIAREIKNHRGQLASLVNLGNAYLYLGDYDKAIKYYQQSLAIAQEINVPQEEAQARNKLGIAYLYMNNYDAAIDYFHQSLAIIQKINVPQEEAQAWNGLGEASLARGDNDAAIKYHHQSLAITQKINDPLRQGQSLGSLGNAYDNLGDYGKAIKYHQQSLAIARKVRDTIGEGQSLNNLGVTLLKSGNLLESEKTLRDGVKVWESNWQRSGNDDNKVSSFEVQSRTYRLLQKVLVAQNKTDTALEIAERGRARAFVELLARRLSSDSTVQRTDAANPAFTNPPTIQQIQQIAKQQNATLVEYSITYNASRVQGKEQWRQSELYIWVIKPTGEVTFRSVDLNPLWQQQKKSLTDLVAKTRESVTQGVSSRGTSNKLIFSPGDLVRLNDDEPKWTPWEVVAVNVQNGTLKLKQPSFQAGVTIERPQADVVEKVTSPHAKNPHLQQMHQLLIQPITDLLPTAPDARVIFIPHESLFLVPFPALQDANGKYLIEKHTILTTPAIQVLELTHQQRQRVSGKDMLIVGNPTMPSIPSLSLAPLPGAEQEAIEIASLLNTKAITGDQATETAIKQQMPKARIIHLATHGLLDDFTGGGVPGAIALAPSGNDNGLLTSNEILDIKLNAELVVLSACDTGRGRITSDGVIGLSRSLISAGVPSVVVSLWLVPDEPTASLMSNFYRQLQQNHDKTVALRQAMLTTMKKHPQPRNWAAFTLIGEAD